MLKWSSDVGPIDIKLTVLFVFQLIPSRSCGSAINDQRDNCNYDMLMLKHTLPKKYIYGNIHVCNRWTVIRLKQKLAASFGI